MAFYGSLVVEMNMDFSLDLLDELHLVEDQKNELERIVKSQEAKIDELKSELSRKEEIIRMYQCQFKGNFKMKPIIVNYALFDSPDVSEPSTTNSAGKLSSQESTGVCEVTPVESHVPPESSVEPTFGNASEFVSSEPQVSQEDQTTPQNSGPAESAYSSDTSSSQDTGVREVPVPPVSSAEPTVGNASESVLSEVSVNQEEVTTPQNSGPAESEVVCECSSSQPLANPSAVAVQAPTSSSNTNPPVDSSTSRYTYLDTPLQSSYLLRLRQRRELNIPDDVDAEPEVDSSVVLLHTLDSSNVALEPNRDLREYVVTPLQNSCISPPDRNNAGSSMNTAPVTRKHGIHAPTGIVVPSEPRPQLEEDVTVPIESTELTEDPAISSTSDSAPNQEWILDASKLLEDHKSTGQTDPETGESKIASMLLKGLDPEEIEKIKLSKGWDNFIPGITKMTCFNSNNKRGNSSDDSEDDETQRKRPKH